MIRTTLVICLFSLASRTALAEVTVDARASLVVDAYRDAVAGRAVNEVPGYALLSVVASGLSIGPLETRLVFNGWAMANPGERVDNRVAGADLQLAYAEASVLSRRLTFRLGRQLVSTGAARNLQLDGISILGTTAIGLGLNVFAGGVVSPRYARRTFDFSTGARAFYRFGYGNEVGAAFFLLFDKGRIGREEVAVDAHFSPVAQLTLSGLARLNLQAVRIAEAEAIVRYTPHRVIALMAAYRHTAPDLFLSRASIFSVFSEEARHEIGGEISLWPHRRVSIDVGSYALVRPAGLGNRSDFRPRLRLGDHEQTTVGIDVSLLMLGDSASVGREGYVETRVFGMTKIARKVLVSLDLDGYFYLRAVNGQSRSLNANLTVAYDITPSWRAALTGAIGSTPYMVAREELIAKVIYVLAAGEQRNP